MICDNCYFREDVIIDSEISGLPLRVDKQCGFVQPILQDEETTLHRRRLVRATAIKRGSCVHYMDKKRRFEVTDGTRQADKAM